MKRIMAVLVAGALGVAACGGSDGAGTAPATGSDDASATTPAQIETEPQASTEPAEPTTSELEPAEPDATSTESSDDAASDETAGDGTADGNAVRVVTDWNGREIEIPAQPERVVALSPTPTMNLALLGFDVIASPIDMTDNFDDAFRAAVPDGTQIDGYEIIGIADSLSLEALAALEPDVILGFDRIEQSEPQAFDVLTQIAPTVLYEFGTNADWRERFRVEAEIVGRTERAAVLEAEYEQALTALADAGDRSVAFVRSEVSGGGLWRLENAATSIPGSIMIEAGVNVFDAPEGIGELNETGSFIPEISGELLGLLTADVIVVQDLTQFGQDPPLDVFATNPIWSTLPAVVAGDVTTLPGLVFNGGTYPSAIQTIDAVARALS